MKPAGNLYLGQNKANVTSNSNRVQVTLDDFILNYNGPWSKFCGCLDLTFTAPKEASNSRNLTAGPFLKFSRNTHDAIQHKHTPSLKSAWVEAFFDDGNVTSVLSLFSAGGRN